MKIKSNKIPMTFNILLIVTGCIAACSTLIPNDYLKLVVVLGCLCVGLYRILRSVGGSGEMTEENENESQS